MHLHIPPSPIVHYTKMSDKKYTGLMRVLVKGAVNLKDTDMVGKSDPYAVISFEHSSEAAPRKQQTHVIKGTQNPVWDSEMYFLVSDECKAFKVELFDEDIGRDDKLGHCHILRKDEDVRYRLTGDNYYLEHGKGGTVEIWTQEIDLKSPINWNSKKAAIDAYLVAKKRDNFGFLEVSLHGAEGLKSGFIDKSDPYAKFDFSNDPQKDQIFPHKLRTRTIDNNPSPVWEETFHFLIPFDLKTFKVQIMDEDTVSDDSLGHVNIAVAKIGTIKAKDKQAVSKKGSLQLSYAIVPIRPLFD